MYTYFLKYYIYSFLLIFICLFLYIYLKYVYLDVPEGQFLAP